MKRNFIEKKKLQKANSHYFLNKCMQLSSDFLDKFSLAKYLKKKTLELKISHKYCYITIQYIIYAFFNLKFFLANLIKDFISMLFLFQLKRQRHLPKHFRIFLNCVKDSIQSSSIGIMHFIWLKEQIIINYLYYRLSLLTNSNFFRKFKNKVLCLKKIRICNSQTSLLYYNQVFKVINQYKLIYNLEKNLLNIRFGGFWKKKNCSILIRNSEFYHEIALKTMFLETLSIQRLIKLKLFYISKKTTAKKLNLGKFNMFLEFYYKKLKKTKNLYEVILSNKIISNDYYNNITYDNLNSSLNTMIEIKTKNLTIKNKTNIFVFLKNFALNSFLFLQLYMDFVNKFFFLTKNKSNCFFFLLKKETVIKIYKKNLNHFTTIQSSYFSKNNNYVDSNSQKIQIYRVRNINNLFLHIKNLLLILKIFDFFRLLKLNISIVKIITSFNNKITKNLYRKSKIDICNAKLTKIYVLKVLSIEKILYYNLLTNKIFLNSNNIKNNSNLILVRDFLINKIISLEKITKKIRQKLKCPANNIKNHIIVQLYKKLNCPIIKFLPKEVVLYRCGHLFSSKCVKDLILSRNRKCPICGKSFGVEDIKQIFLF